MSTEFSASCVVTPRWKLAYFPEQGEGRMWDRIADPEENNNLFDSADEEIARARDGLLIALLRWRAQQNPLGWMKAKISPGSDSTPAQTPCTSTSKRSPA